MKEIMPPQLIEKGRLILTRRPGQIITINDDITVMVASIDKNQVKLVITAPKDVQIHRQEIYDRIQLEKQGREMIKPENGREFYCA